MNKNRTLSDLREGDSARVSAMLSDGGIRRRLRDMGLVEGTLIRCMNRSPLGDPTAYFVRGTVIALRREDSSRILIDSIQ